MQLEGKTAIVTGAARGIGYAVAERLLFEGARVMIADIDESTGAEALESLSPHGQVMFAHCDVGERLDIRNAIAETLDAFGDIDILVNNAGIAHRAAFLELAEDDFDRVLRTNLKGHFLFGQAIARHMVENVEAGKPAGAIVNMSSINATLATAEQLAYCVSKSAIDQLTRAMALALAPYRIRVNAVGPGSINTDLHEDIAGDRAQRNRILSRTPLLRLGEASEIAAAVCFLASEEASYITGQTIYADGGRMSLDLTVPVPETP